MADEKPLSAMQHHKKVMLTCKLPEEVISLIEKESTVDPYKGEWIYLCALDRMPQKQLAELSKLTVLQIQKQRQEYLRKRYTDSNAAAMESLKVEVKQTCDESRELQVILRKSMELALESQKDALAKQAASHEQAIKAKDDLLAAQEKQLVSYKEMLRKQPKGEAKDVREAVVLRSTEQNHQNSRWSVIPRIKTFERIKNKRASKQFITDYLKDPDYTEEQKEYLMKCLEEGVPIRQIRQFAAPGLPVETMQRIRTLQGKEKP